jgi:hypothetical protein
MNREDIIRMAREAGFNEIQTNAMVFGAILERFAALVAGAEREACAKVCESLFDLEDDSCNEAEQCAAAIRARGQA